MNYLLKFIVTYYIALRIKGIALNFFTINMNAKSCIANIASGEARFSDFNRDFTDFKHRLLKKFVLLITCSVFFALVGVTLVILNNLFYTLMFLSSVYFLIWSINEFKKFVTVKPGKSTTIKVMPLIRPSLGHFINEPEVALNSKSQNDMIQLIVDL